MKLKDVQLVRLHKYIADCGIASRRKAEDLIRWGDVTVNGQVVKEMGYKVIAGKDAVKVKNKLLRPAAKNLVLHGCDVVDKVSSKNFKFNLAAVDNLPFGDKEFDIVTCFHTLEHVLKLEKAASELQRITKLQLMVVVPCQRYFYYTLDEHVNFFDFQEKLTSLFSFEKFECAKIGGDWIYIGYR